MTTNWTRVSALFAEALDLDARGRETFLVDLAARDPASAAEVRALLDAHERAGGTFLERPAWAVAPDLMSEPVLTGRLIGPYIVREVIGRGGMGVVYAAEDTRLGRSVALKALPQHVSRDPVARERLAREARAAAALSHPSIATVYALEELDGDLFIASELVRGRTLRAEIVEGPLGAELLPTLTQIAEALDAAHRQGIVHRDLKPENVMRNADGRIKVVDFGLARSLTPSAAQGLTVGGAALGTPGYMAPEQLRGERPDARADVFAFGVIAYELATGTHPFGGSDPAALLERLLSEDPVRTLTPPTLDAIVRRCLRGDRALRFGSGTELLAAVRAALAGPAAPTSQSLPRTAWWWQFHQVAVTFVTIAAVIVLGVHRHWLDPYGSSVFLAALVLATICVTLRLHMWFVSLVDAGGLVALRKRVLRWVMICESLFLALIMGVGSALAGPHDGTAAYMVVTAMLLLLSLIVIEPATTRAALEGTP